MSVKCQTKEYTPVLLFMTILLVSLWISLDNKPSKGTIAIDTEGHEVSSGKIIKFIILGLYNN